LHVYIANEAKTAATKRANNLAPGTLTAEPAPFLVPLLEEEVLLEAPLVVPALPPLFAEKLNVVPEVCEPPAELKPGPFPAPFVKKVSVPEGKFGTKFVPTTHEGSFRGGQVDAEPEAR